MSFIFDENTAPDLANWRETVRFCMVSGNTRAVCQIAFETLRDLGPDEIETDAECLNRFHLHRAPITGAAARLLAKGAHEGGTIIQIMRANMP